MVSWGWVQYFLVSRRARAEQVCGVSGSSLKVSLGKAEVKFHLAFSGWMCVIKSTDWQRKIEDFYCQSCYKNQTIDWEKSRGWAPVTSFWDDKRKLLTLWQLFCRYKILFFIIIFRLFFFFLIKPLRSWKSRKACTFSCYRKKEGRLRPTDFEVWRDSVIGITQFNSVTSKILFPNK